jgi:formate dehydrogenase major subunit
MHVSRRSFLKMATAGLTLSGVGFNVKGVEAAAYNAKLKGAKEYTSICNFCSCSCGLVAHVTEGKLVNLEGDPDHIINEGSLCSKGAAMGEIVHSPERVTTPLYRAPGASAWEKISWDDAINRVAKKMKETRDKNWISTEKVGDKEFTVNRTDALGFLGGAQNNNEECYLMSKMARLAGAVFVEHQARL